MTVSPIACSRRYRTFVFMLKALPCCPPIARQVARLDHIKGRLLEHLGDGGCIVGGIGERGNVLVARITDDECDALSGQGGLIGKANRQKSSDKGGKPAH